MPGCGAAGRREIQTGPSCPDLFGASRGFSDTVLDYPDKPGNDELGNVTEVIVPPGRNF